MVVVNHRVQEKLNLLRVNAQQCLSLSDQLLFNHRDGNAYAGTSCALGAACFKYVEHIVLYCKLDLLNIKNT